MDNKHFEVNVNLPFSISVWPLDNHLPLLYELLYGYKSRMLMPSSRNDFKSRFFDDKKHKEKNYEGEKDKLNCITEKSVFTKEF